MTSERFVGLPVCDGIALGRVHVVDRRRLAVPHFHVAPERRAAEVDRFVRAIEASAAQFAELREHANETGLRPVELLLDAHSMMLCDPVLRDATLLRIEHEGKNAEWAFAATANDVRARFEGLDRDYFRDRRGDIDIVTDRVLRNLIGAEVELVENLSEDAIVVAHDLSPADTVALAKYAARAFVTESGGRTSHTAILARALNVPCVLGVHGIMDVAGTGDEIIVDGTVGEVVLLPTKRVAGRFRSIARRRRRAEEALFEDRNLPAETTDGAEVELLGNIEVAAEVEGILAQGGMGVGLYRTEFLYIERPALSGADEHYGAYRNLVFALHGRPLTIRTVDAGGDKFVQRGLAPEVSRESATPNEVNPALGMRAIRLSLRRHERQFREQLEGIVRASAHGPIRILLPLVTELEELRRVRTMLGETHEALERRGIAHVARIPLGVMIETPAAASIADLFANEADFLSLGTNDLVQYALATDRRNEEVAYLYRPCHPAILRMIRFVSRAAAVRACPLGICGEMAADPFHVPVLLGLGLRTLSMSAKSIPIVRRIVRRLSADACANMVDELVDLPTASDIERVLAARLAEWVPDLLPTGLRRAIA